MALKGYHGTSMRDLVQATNRSLAGLYHYFKNKEDLLYLINLRGFSSLLEGAASIGKMDVDSEEKLYAFISRHIEYFDAHRDEMKVMMVGTQALDGARRIEIRKLKEKYTEIGQKIVGEFYAGQTKRKLGRDEVVRRTFLLFGMMNWMYAWYVPTKHGAAIDLINDVYQGFTTGILGKRKKTKKNGRIYAASLEEIKNEFGFNNSKM